MKKVRYRQNSFTVIVLEAALIGMVLYIACIVVACAPHSSTDVEVRAPATGPLRIHPSNPRYFTDGSGKAVYLTGSHAWENLKDRGTTDPPEKFDNEAYLDFLV
jgi:hypothetical protein